MSDIEGVSIVAIILLVALLLFSTVMTLQSKHIAKLNADVVELQKIVGVMKNEC